MLLGPCWVGTAGPPSAVSAQDWTQRLVAGITTAALSHAHGALVGTVLAPGAKHLHQAFLHGCWGFSQPGARALGAGLRGEWGWGAARKQSPVPVSPWSPTASLLPHLFSTSHVPRMVRAQISTFDWGGGASKNLWAYFKATTTPLSLLAVSA